MEAASHAQPLISIESFSHSWLLNLNPSTFEFDFDHDCYNNDHDQDQTPENSSFRHCSSLDFIEMDPRLPASRRFFVRAGSHDFNFAFPPSISDSPLAHADQLISDGILMPLFVNPLKPEDQESDSSTPCDRESIKVKPSPKIRCSSYSKRSFLKYFAFLVPFCKKICNGSRSRSRSRSSRVEAVYSSSDNWRRSSCDSESSIHEAVLHCKRSIGTK